MARSRSLIYAVASGAVLALVVLFLISRGCNRPDSGPAVPTPVVEDEHQFKDDGLVRTRTATIYQLAPTTRLSLKPVRSEIVWFQSPVERARELVRLVLDGVESEGVIKPAPGVESREVFIDTTRRVAWIDLDNDRLGSVSGTDGEAALVGCLARTLVENLEEVDRVGILIDGKARKTLAGHLDLARTYTGREWPAVNS